MTVPMAAMLTLLIVGVFISTLKHGQPRPAYNWWGAAYGAGIFALVLWWGGFWG